MRAHICYCDWTVCRESGDRKITEFTLIGCAMVYSQEALEPTTFWVGGV